MTFRILEDPNVPNVMKGAVASEAIRAAEARAKAEQDKRDAKRQQEAQIQATLAQFEAERVKREEKEEKEKREREAQRFEDDLRASFFAGNLGADESDWTRNRRAILDDAMRERAAGRGPVDAARERLLKTGRYAF